MPDEVNPKLFVWASVRITTKFLARNGIVSTEEDEQRLYNIGMEISRNEGKSLYQCCEHCGHDEPKADDHDIPCVVCQAATDPYEGLRELPPAGISGQTMRDLREE